MPIPKFLPTKNFGFQGMGETGADLRFVAGDKTVLKHQIEQLDPLLGIAGLGGRAFRHLAIASVLRALYCRLSSAAP